MLLNDGTSIRNDKRHLGEYESVPAVVEYIDTRAAYDETGGDVESPTGWFGLAGRWVITCNERGSFSAYKHATVADAQIEFYALEQDYSAWGDDEWDDLGDDWDDPDHPLNP